jgi:hypothetical protein
MAQSQAFQSEITGASSCIDPMINLSSNFFSLLLHRRKEIGVAT